MIKNYQQFINEDLRSKNITLPEIKIDNLKKLYPNIGVNYNDNLKIVISYDGPLGLDEEFYKILEKDNIKIEDIIFDDCKEILLYENKNFTKISDYGKFGKGIKDFYCSGCDNLQSLNGCPKNVGGNFYCSHCNNLQSLNGCPKEVKDNFNCYGCDKLQSLEGAPKNVNGNFNCSRCKNLQSLNGCPENVNGDFYCSHCNNLQSLEGYPEKVGGDFNCSNCDKLQSLNGAPENVNGDFYCYGCNLDFIELAKQKYGDKVKYK